MSKVVAIEHITLDGVMQGPARPDEDTRDGFEYGGWAAARNDPAMMEVLGARMGSSWSLLVGRTTYEDFAKVWPNQPKPNPFTEVDLRRFRGLFQTENSARKGEQCHERTRPTHRSFAEKLSGWSEPPMRIIPSPGSPGTSVSPMAPLGTG